MMNLLKLKRGKTSTTVEEPILTAEDEDFLQRITTDGEPSEHPPPLPARPGSILEAGNPEGNNLQVALLENPDHIPLPETRETIAQDKPHKTADGEAFTREDGGRKVKKSKWSWKRRDSRDAKLQKTATDLLSAAEHTKSANATSTERPTSNSEAQEEESEMADVLEQLNLAAVDNRVFSLSKESRELLSKFTFVLKDLVNGVPTAYGDLESLLTNSEDQLQRSYKHLPPWIQKLVEQLPSKMTKSITPELLAAAAEKAGAEKTGVKVAIPSLKDLVTKPGVVVTMLKAIMNFLKLRFPAFLGMNVLYSLALFAKDARHANTPHEAKLALNVIIEKVKVTLRYSFADHAEKWSPSLGLSLYSNAPSVL
ncbi:uncharacterized protein KY384_000641 [Bacidia gigantensis]|uniref:uncharacterized protein n=1 Tax=Bacidia gigantensis TaxID=2732470 RepID=UPI001D037FB3|nr:uncharacterized protein KY384_000641 [Bacidia gigantensis]KAG8525881.1 hypothetical protein KY384_000641 [Bacidia gigantensis]